MAQFHTLATTSNQYTRYCKICMISKFFFAFILIFHTALVLLLSTFVFANNEVSFNIIKPITRVEYTLFSQKIAMKKNYVLNFKLFLSMELLTSASQPISKFSFDGWFCKYAQICSSCYENKLRQNFSKTSDFFKFLRVWIWMQY